MKRTAEITAQPTRVAWSLLALIVVAPVWWTATTTYTIAQESEAKISKEQASQNALQAVPGKVTDVSVERKRDKNVYVVEIVAKKDGEETDVLIDMDSGKVLGTER
jgi:uncharacterized membrane protein YkoI